jgi:hypothetical protein
VREVVFLGAGGDTSSADGSVEEVVALLALLLALPLLLDLLLLVLPLLLDLLLLALPLLLDLLLLALPLLLDLLLLVFSSVGGASADAGSVFLLVVRRRVVAGFFVSSSGLPQVGLLSFSHRNSSSGRRSLCASATVNSAIVLTTQSKAAAGRIFSSKSGDGLMISVRKIVLLVSVKSMALTS